MIIADTAWEIDVRHTRARRRSDEEGRLRRLLRRTDALLDEAERANLKGAALRATFRTDLINAAREIDLALLTPTPEKVRPTTIGFALAMRGWTLTRLSREADLTTATLDRSSFSESQKERLAEALERFPVEVEAADCSAPINPQAAVDAVFDLQAALFVAISGEVERSLSAEDVEEFGRVCEWLEGQGDVLVESLSERVSELLDPLIDARLVRMVGAYACRLTVNWRPILEQLEAEVRGVGCGE